MKIIIQLPTLLATLLLVVNAHGQSVVLTDSVFDVNMDWTDQRLTFRPSSATNADQNLKQESEGGDSYLEWSMTRAAADSGDVDQWGTVISEALSYNIDSNVPVLNVCFKIDARRSRDERVFTMALRQDGFVWIAQGRSATLDESDWQTVDIGCLSADDFIRLPFANDAQQPLAPNFESGSTLFFGMAYQQTCPTSADCSSSSSETLDLDNLEITLATNLSINQGMADAWYDPPTSGQGIYVSVWESADTPGEGLLSFAWFTFDVERPDPGVEATVGEPGHRWLTGLGPYSGDTATLDLTNTAGLQFDTPTSFPPGTRETVGTATLVWTDCSNAVLTYDMPALSLNGEIPLVRAAGSAAAKNAALCADLQSR